MTTAAFSDRATVPAVDDFWPFAKYLFFLALLVACFIAFDFGVGQLHNGDSDDYLRAIQVRTLLEAGGWYDLTLPMVRGPEAYVSPWSRLVDLPYAAIALVLRPFIGLERAAAQAFQIWPPVMASIFSLLAVAVLRRIAPLRSQLPIFVLIVMTILMPYAIWEFSPGRIDHHNVQILLLLLIAYGLTRFDAVGGVAVGVGAPAAMAIGLETLPVVALALVVIAAAWWFDMHGSRRMLQVTGLACLVATVLLTAALIPPSAYLTLHNDAFSAPYTQALVGFGALAAGLPALLPRHGSTIIRFGTFTGLGLAVIAVILIQYPTLRDGPFPMIDAVVQRYWFDRIHQEKTVLLFFQLRNWTGIFLVTSMFVILIAGTPAAVRSVSAGSAPLPAFYMFAVAALVLTCVSNRFLRLALAIVPLLLPIAVGEAIRWIRASRRGTTRISKAVGAPLCVVAVVGLLAVAVPEKPDVDDAFDYLLTRGCDSEDFSPLAKLSGSSIMTPPAIGLRIAMRAPRSVTVSSIPFHRSSPAISRVIRTFMAQTAAERMALLGDFDYLALCRAPVGLPNEKSLPLFAALMADEKVPGLEPVALAAPTKIMLFRIDKTVAR